MHPHLHHARTRTLRIAAIAAVALLAWGLSPALHAQEGASAVPEFIELTEADLQTPLGAELASAQQAFRTSLGDDPARALELAKRIVALTSEAYGESHDHVSRALTNLAIVQAENANFDAAVENYIAAIGARERASGTIVSRDLINPLRGLASAYMALDEVELAIPVFERAIHVSGVNDGPNNLEQVGIIDALSRAHYFSGDFDAADDLQDAVFRLRARQSDDNPDLYLDALEQRAAWYGRLENHGEAVRFYQRLVRAITDEYGEDDVRLIEPLSALAYAAARVPDRRLTGKRAIGRAVRIAREHADGSPELLARTLVEEGDWYLSQGARRHFRGPYGEAWDILDEDPALHPVRDALFATPKRLSRTPLRPIYGLRVDETASPALYPDSGYIDAVFDVDENGRPENVRIVDAEPPGLMDVHVRYQIGRFRYRPTYGDGRPRAFTGLSYRHEFRYDASGLTDRERDIIATTTYGAGAAPENTSPGEVGPPP